ncbi:MAG TPA: hypothetical protein VFQ61_30940, partial [Polyangiaceae bacterium]|nr:hypothetical protein [Polyangiaceae bacterium]
MTEANDAIAAANTELDRVAVRLAALHGELDEIFLLHQECLMLGHLELAEQVLAGFAELLALHAQHEETWFLPLYEVVGVEARFPLVLYRGQHRKMLGMVRSFQARTAELSRNRTMKPSELRRRVLALFDEHARFKHLLEHHDG